MTQIRVCGPVVHGTSNSTDNFGCRIGSGEVSSNPQFSFAKVVISSFTIGVEMQKISKVKTKISSWFE